MPTQTVIIAGITGGIGAALARRLHQDGWSVAGFARDRTRLDALAKDLPGLATVVAEATDAGAVEAAVADLTARLGGRLDGYVHAVGSIVMKSADRTRDEEWLATLNLNLTSAFWGLRAAVSRQQRQEGGGAIVLISSVAAQVGLPNHEAIGAAKAGVEGLVRSAAATYAPRKVRVNAVAPGLVHTPLAHPLLSSDLGRKAAEALHPIGRIGQPEEVASLIAWLLGTDAGWVTGQCWALDGGTAALRSKPKV